MSKKKDAVQESGQTMTRELPVKLTDADIGMKARAREELEEEIGELESEMKGEVEKFKEKIKAKEEEVKELREMIRSGIERRRIMCRAERDAEHGRIVFIREDTKEVVDWRPMTADEKQLTIGDAKAAAEASAVPPAPPMPDAPAPAFAEGRVVRDGSLQKLREAHAIIPPSGDADVDAAIAHNAAPESDRESGIDLVNADTDLPPPPVDESTHPLGLWAVDVEGHDRLIGETIAENLRDANLHMAVCFLPLGADEMVELSHIKGEPVRVVAKRENESGSIVEAKFDLMPSEVKAMRDARYSSADGVRLPADYKISRGGHEWTFMRLATQEAPEEPKAKRGAKKGSKKAAGS